MTLLLLVTSLRFSPERIFFLSVLFTKRIRNEKNCIQRVKKKRKKLLDVNINYECNIIIQETNLRLGVLMSNECVDRMCRYGNYEAC